MHRHCYGRIAYNDLVLPHCCEDYDVLAAVHGAYAISPAQESFDWMDGVIDDMMRIENGSNCVSETEKMQAGISA